MLPEFKIALRPNNQVTLTLQNVVRARKDICQHRYIGRDHYVYEDEIGVWTHRPELVRWQKKLLADRIKEEELKRNQHAKCKKHTKISPLHLLTPPLDIIRKSQRTPWLFWRVGFKFLVLKKVVSAILYFSEYRLSKAKHFGNIQGQKIREAGAVIDILCDGRPEFAHVTTLTLPSNSEESFDCIAARSGYAINRLWEPIRKAYGSDVAWFFVWEYQKRGALHLHICHYHPDASEGMLIGNMLIDKWDKILHDISDETGIDMFSPKEGRMKTLFFQHQHHTQPMYKSAGGYFSKYASKASKSDENNYVRRFSKIRPPTRFWGSSRTVKELIKENSFSFSETSISSTSEQNFYSIRELLLEEEIISFNEFAWDIKIREANIASRRPDVNIESKPIKYLSVKTLSISQGKSQVFYVSPCAYKKLLGLIPRAVEGLYEYF